MSGGLITQDSLLLPLLNSWVATDFLLPEVHEDDVHVSVFFNRSKQNINTCILDMQNILLLTQVNTSQPHIMLSIIYIFIIMIQNMEFKRSMCTVKESQSFVAEKQSILWAFLFL